MYCCGDKRGFKKYSDRDIICYFLPQCPRCGTSRIILLENNTITKTHGKNAKNLFNKFRHRLKEEKIPSPAPSPGYIPLKYYRGMAKGVQKEMYSGCELPTGVVKKSEIKVFYS